MNSVSVRGLGFWSLKFGVFFCVLYSQNWACASTFCPDISTFCPVTFSGHLTVVHLLFPWLLCLSWFSIIINCLLEWARYNYLMLGFLQEPVGETTDLAEGLLTWACLWAFLFIPIVNSLVKCKDGGTGSVLRLLAVWHGGRFLKLHTKLIFSGVQLPCQFI